MPQNLEEGSISGYVPDALFRLLMTRQRIGTHQPLLTV